jgi:hypothetical protein
MDGFVTVVGGTDTKPVKVAAVLDEQTESCTQSDSVDAEQTHCAMQLSRFVFPVVSSSSRLDNHQL